MDYYVWGPIQKDTNSPACNAKSEIVTKIKKVCKELLKDTMIILCSRSEAISGLWQKLKSFALSKLLLLSHNLLDIVLVVLN